MQPRGEAPAGLWRIPLQSSEPLKCVAPVSKNRLVAVWRSGVGKADNHCAVWDHQMTSQCSPFLFAPVASADAVRSVAAVQCTAVCAVGARWFWCGWSSGHVSCHDDEAGDPIDTLFAHRAPVVSIRAANDRVATTSGDGHLLLWAAGTRQVLRTLTVAAAVGMVRCVDIAVSGPVWVGYESGAVVEYAADDTDGCIVGSHRTAVSALTTTPQGLAWTGCAFGVVKVHAPSNASGFVSSRISLALQQGRINAMAPLQAKMCLVAAAGMSSVAALTLDSQQTIIVAFLVDVGKFVESPKLQTRPIRGQEAVSTVAGLVALSSNTVVALGVSGLAVALLFPNHGPTEGASDLHSISTRQANEIVSVATPIRQKTATATSDPTVADAAEAAVSLQDYRSLELRYERALLTMRRVVTVTKDKALALKLSNDDHALATSRAAARCSQLEEQCRLLIAALDEKTNETTQLSSQVTNLLVSDSRLKNLTEQSTTATREWETRYVESKQECVKLHRVLEQYRTQCEELSTNNAELVARCEAALSRADRAESAGQRAEEEVGRLTTALEATRKRAVAADKRADESEEGLRDAISQLRALTVECSTLHLEIEAKSREVDAVSRAYKECVVQLAYVKDAAATSERENFRLKHMEGVPEANGTVHAVLERCNTLEAECDELRRRLVNAEIELVKRDTLASSDPSALVSPPRRPKPKPSANAAHLVEQARKLLADRRASSPFGIAQRIADRDHLQTPSKDAVEGLLE